MTSYQESKFSYTEATLRREVQTDNSHWELMYKAMLAQLMTCVDAAVERALADRGLDETIMVRTLSARSQRGPGSAPRPAAAEAAELRLDPTVTGPFAGVVLPPWLQPFAVPEHVSFTRTPDSLLRADRAAEPEADEALDAPLDPAPMADAVPHWKRPVVLPANVRFNRTPDPRPAEADGDEVEAQTFTDDRAPLHAGDAIPAVIAAPVDVEAERAAAALIEAHGAEREAEDELAAAWLQAHARIVADRALRLTDEPSVDEVPATVEAVALDPHASIHPDRDLRRRAAAESTLPPAEALLHPYGDAAFWIEGLAEAPRTMPGLPPEPLAADPAPEGPDVRPEAAAPGSADVLALPAPSWLSPDAATGEDPAAAEIAPIEDARAPGDASPWLALVGDPEEPGQVPSPLGIASPADARASVGPVRAGIRRGGAAHGAAPFSLSAVVTAGPDTYEDPPLDLLMLPPEPAGEVVSSGALEQNARLLEGVLEEFGIRGEIIDVRPGPVVTLYELEPAPGTKSSRVIGLADDIARSMSAVSARVAVVQGRNVIGIELPNQRRETVYLRELVDSEDFTRSKHRLAIALGKTIGGESVIVDLARMPHLLVAGTTGSGKSVAINTMILSILYRLKPEECRLIMIDPKMLELSIYEGIPHLLTPVVTDPKKAVVALKWAVREMEDRYKKMSKVGVRNIDGFNARVVEAATRGEIITRTIQTGFNRETGEPIFETEQMELSPLPYIVVIVDEMADLMMVAGKDIEGAIQRLAQMARAAGIHLIMATQRPSVDVITGTIKANFPTRISFQVTSKIDSRTILGEQGAEQLLGQGDMLHMAGGGRISRVHGPFVSDGEVEGVVAHLKAQGHPAYLDVVVAEEGDDAKAEPADDKPVFDRTALAAGGEDDNELYDQAVKVVLRDKKCSTSYIQRRLQVGYNKAASLVERMEKEGIVGQANNAGKREILVYSRDLRFTESRDGEE